MATNFRRYDHLERLGHSEVRGLDIGKVYVFPKLDGTNASVWWDGVKVCGGSRNRALSVYADNHGFMAWLLSDSSEAVALREYVEAHPNHIVYGEMLVPHTLKTYRAEAWRRFWVFDVFDVEAGAYLPYDDYAPALRAAGVNDIIDPLCTIKNPTPAQLQAQLATNTWLIQDGAGVGEGVVMKRYDWRNIHGRQPWAKLVCNDFREANQRAFGYAEKRGAFSVELAAAEEFCTPALVGKTRAKVVADIANSQGLDLMEPNAQSTIEIGYRSKVIPQLLGRVYCDLVKEEIWSIIKKYKDPAIDFGLLRRHVEQRTKALAADLFA